MSRSPSSPTRCCVAVIVLHPADGRRAWPRSPRCGRRPARRRLARLTTRGEWSQPPDRFLEEVRNGGTGHPRPVVVLDPVGIAHDLGTSPKLGSDAALADAVAAGHRYLADPAVPMRQRRRRFPARRRGRGRMDGRSSLHFRPGCRAEVQWQSRCSVLTGSTA
jgi:hypothetical protein